MVVYRSESLESMIWVLPRVLGRGKVGIYIWSLCIVGMSYQQCVLIGGGVVVHSVSFA